MSQLTTIYPQINAYSTVINRNLEKLYDTITLRRIEDYAHDNLLPLRFPPKFEQSSVNFHIKHDIAIAINNSIPKLEHPYYIDPIQTIGSILMNPTYIQNLDRSIQLSILNIYRKTEKYTDQLLETIDKNTLKLIHNITKDHTVLYSVYIGYHRNYAPMEELNRTNPGIARIYHRIAPLDKHIEHPSEITRYVQEYMAEPKIDFKYFWKKLTKTPNTTIQVLTRNLTPHSRLAKILLIFAAKHQIELTTADSEWIKNLNSSPIHHLTNDSMLLYTELLMKHIKTNPDYDIAELKHQIIDILDFLQSPNVPELYSTTWNGLLEHSNRWHREQRAINNAIRNKQTNEIVHWSSPITDPIEIDEYLFTPLLTSDDLFAESDRMQHCVRSYTSTCASGESRIFAIEKTENTSNYHAATVELVRSPSQSWSVRQLRGYRNQGALPEKLTNNCKQLAQKYTQMWETMPQPKHESWLTLRESAIKE